MPAPVSTLLPKHQHKSPTPAARSKKADTDTFPLERHPIRTVLPAGPASIPVEAPSSEEDTLSSASVEAAVVSDESSSEAALKTPTTDPLEAEANMAAEQATRNSSPSRAIAGEISAPLRRLEDDNTVPAATPPHARQALHSPGLPLDSTTRALMEERFGWNFAPVRIHSGPAAAESASLIGAQAYTVGNHIVFASGRLQPGTPEGRHLLAHELAHVTRQSQGVARGTIQAQRDPHSAKLKRARRKGVHFKVWIDHPMGPAELMRTFIRQYYHLHKESEVKKKFPLWHWESFPRQAAAKGKHFINLLVIDPTQTEVEAMSKEERAKLNRETDQRFWKQTHYKPGKKLGKSAEDREKAREWLGVRADILLERKQLEAIRALPKDIKKILFAGGRPLVPDDYQKILSLADKLSKLTPAQRQDYLSKVNADTDSFSELEASIDRYMFSQKLQAAEEEKTEKAAEKLFGLEDLYKLYRAKEAANQRERIVTDMGGYSPAVSLAAADATAKFTIALKESHFKSEREFLDAIEAYRLRFRSEAVHLAMEVLARYEHMLFLARKRYSNPANAAALVMHISATKAKEHYKEAESKATAASLRAFSVDPEDVQGVMQAGMEAAQLREQSHQLETQAESEVIQASGNDPLIDPKKLGRGTDREKLANLNAAGAQQYLLQVIEDREQDLAKARAAFVEDPERIFSQPELVEATKQSQHIGKNTIYSRIIDDYIANEKQKHLFSSIVLGIIAVILAALVPGGGWVAAAALVAGATISTVQAIETIDEYNKHEVEYRLNFIQDEPSLAWVVVAVAAAALDMGMATSAVLKASATGLKEIEAPLKAFSEASDVETAAARLKTLNAKIDEVEGLQKEVKEALKVKAEAELGLRKALGKAAGTTYASLGGAVDPTPVFEAIYYGIKKGANTITKLRGETKILALMGDVTKMSGATRDELVTAFEQVKKIISIGQQRGMDDATILTYVDRLAAQRAQGAAAFEAVTEDMGAWSKPRVAAGGATGTAATSGKTPVIDTGPGVVPDSRTAGTGGIQKIEEKYDALGVRSTTIEGELKPGMNRMLAPNFNRAWKRSDLADQIASSLIARKNMDQAAARQAADALAGNYEAAHLWGPGFGDEAAAGMLWAPIDVNQNMQNRFAELFARDLQKAVNSGGKVTITATSIPFDSETLIKNGLPANAKFLEHAEYKIAVEMPGKPPMEVRITVTAGVPGPKATGSIELDPPDLAERFMKYFKK